MSQYEKLDGNKAKLTIEVEPSIFAKAIDTAYKRNAGHFQVPGFRKGKAPRKVIEKAYGEVVFYEDAFDLCWADAFQSALDEHELTAVDQPDLEIVNISEQDGVTFTAEVQLYPEVILGQYQGIEQEKQEYTVSDEEINAELDKARHEQARIVTVERPVENGDSIVLDYRGTVDGVAFEGGTAEEQELVIGSGSFIPGFEEQLVGAAAGEERDITVTFPTEYHAEELAGKEAVFHCNIKAVRCEELPEVDDDFIADISEYNNVDEWKQATSERLYKEHSEKLKNAFENAVLAKVCDNAQVDIPDCMINRQLDRLMREMESSMQRSGFNMELYCQYLNTTPEQIREERRPEASMRVKMELVLDAIVKAEQIEATEEDVENNIKTIADEYKMDAETFKASLRPDDLEFITENVKTKKAYDLIINSAVAL